MIACKGPKRLLFLSFVGLGCSTSTSSDNSAVFTGTYDVVSVNGQQLPLLLGACRCADFLSNNQGCTLTGLRGERCGTF